jgi:hypothetical protein
MWDISGHDSASAGRLYQIKITLKWSKPPIWRRVQVQADMPLVRFHAVIQLVIGWTNSHLHQFVLGQVFYGRPDPEMPHIRNEKRYPASDLAPAAKSQRPKTRNPLNRSRISWYLKMMSGIGARRSTCGVIAWRKEYTSCWLQKYSRG